MYTENLIIRSDLSVGDIVMLTAAIRDLHAAHPGKYKTDVRTFHPDLWLNNPNIIPLTEGKEIIANYDLVQQSNQKPYHFIHGYRKDIQTTLGIPIPMGEFRGDIHLTDEERNTRPFEFKYWVIASGGKNDFTTKWWDPERWQAVVDYWHARGIKFVQVGDRNDPHPDMHNVTDMRGKTSLRQLINLIQHSEGVLCHVTSLMHIAAALPLAGGRIRPCVVVAGGREQRSWEAYNGHRYLDTIGQLSCCDSGGCWKSRVVPGIGGSNDDSLCVRPIEIRPGKHLPACLDRITAEHVIEAMRGYMLVEPPIVESVGGCKGCGGGSHKPGPISLKDPTSWGPDKWRIWHARSGYGITAIDKEKELTFIAEFTDALPCELCKKTFFAHLIKHPAVLDSVESYKRWQIDMHNLVNVDLGKGVLDYETAEKEINRRRNRLHAETQLRGKICLGCEFFQRATAEVRPMCTRFDPIEPLLMKLKSGQCDKWPGYIEPPEVVAPAQSSGALGLVIGTYGAVPYIHLQLESLKRFHPGTPCLVVDDGSDQREELAALCKEYGVEFLGRDKRMNHARGDMQVFIEGHSWAQRNGIKLLVKFSRRWVPTATWQEEALRLWKETKAPTLSNVCMHNEYGFRTECLAMDVTAWKESNALSFIQTKIDDTAGQPSHWVAGDCGVLVEGEIHHASKLAQEHVNWVGNNTYAPWPWMGESRAIRYPGIIWHVTDGPDVYHRQLLYWGIGYELVELGQSRLV